MREIIRIEPKMPLTAPRKRVAAYCRVSMETERLSHSLAAQTSYYSALIRSNPEWEYAGVYADSFISGTRAENRPELMKLLADCEEGKIQIILTKSISRFARNTVDLLKIVRRLKALGISIRFEKESVDSLSGDGELMLTILAVFAEEESKSISSNVAWAARKKFRDGEQWHKAAFGYRWDGSTFVAESEEALVIRRIYNNYLENVPLEEIARRVGFSRSRVSYILRNEVYCGDLILQKTYGTGPLGNRRPNRGELPSYYVSDNHEAIVDAETWAAVQARIRAARESAPDGGCRLIPRISVFSGKIECGKCGSHYVKGVVNGNKTDGMQERWTCCGKASRGTGYCSAKNFCGDRLRKASATVLGLSEFDEKVFSARIEKIVANGDDKLEFHFYGGFVRSVPISTYQPNQRSVCDPHKPFPGYVWTRSGYQIVPEEAETVRMVFQLYIEGNSVRSICASAAAAGVKSFRGKISAHFISRMLDDERYTGTRILSARYSGTGREERIPGDHEPIIPAELFEKVRARRKAVREKYAAAGREQMPLLPTEREGGEIDGPNRNGTTADDQP